MRVIAEITAQLDGLPLAIELAAAYANYVDLEQLAAMLKDRPGLCSLSSRTAHTRHQTLAATISWSYDLLTPEEDPDRRVPAGGGRFGWAISWAAHFPTAWHDRVVPRLSI